MENSLKTESIVKTYSEDRLLAFKYTEFDTIQDIIANYQDNIKISQSFYPELCTIEVILRNAINEMLQKFISETWVEDEINNQSLLENFDYQTLLNTYNSTKDDCKAANKDFTIGRVIANLNFGFWTNLCGKKYGPKIWNKPICFYTVFENYPYKMSIADVSKKLYMIRKFRNRVFHYEKIFRYPQKTLIIYNTICEVLSYLPKDKFDILKQTSNFLQEYNSLQVHKTIK